MSIIVMLHAEMRHDVMPHAPWWKRQRQLLYRAGDTRNRERVGCDRIAFPLSGFRSEVR
jgi:hypothetical protein